MNKWLKQRKRDKRGLEIRDLVQEMLDYVKARYVPEIRYSIRYTGECSHAAVKKKETIPDMEAFKQEAAKDPALYGSPAMEKTYHAWEQDHSERKSFSSEVVRMVGERYQKISDFYRASGIDKRTFYKIRSDFGYVPSRKTAFRCCIGLRLNVEEAEALLKLAGMAFSPNNPDDLVIKFCLEKGICDIPGVNYMLYQYATRPLDK